MLSQWLWSQLEQLLRSNCVKTEGVVLDFFTFPLPLPVLQDQGFCCQRSLCQHSTVTQPTATMFPRSLQSRNNFTNSSASDAGNFKGPRLMSQVGRVREVVWADINVSAVSAVQVTAFVCLHCSCGRRVVRFVRLPLKVFIQNDRDFMDVILLYAVNHAIEGC